jgi:dTDP-4-amino-4,6-dideoxygalactose transaminase
MIPYGQQSISQQDIDAVTIALKGDYLTNGPLVEEFESLIENLVGAPAVVVSSGTAALHCAYAAINLQQGDEIITPPLTFIATQAAAAMRGAKIIFADIQDETGNIDPAAVEAAISQNTKAIVAVDFAGHPADLDELRQIADRRGVYLIEDAAHAIGSRYKGRPVGSIADLTTFSFFPTKNITTGEGGAVASIHPELLRKARLFSRQGLIRDKENFVVKEQGPWHQEVHEFGLNYRLPDLLCALGISQIKRIEKFKHRRREIFRQYVSELTGVKDLLLPVEKTYVSSNWHLFPIRVSQEYRESLFNALRRNGIGVQVNYFPAHLQPVMEAEGYTLGDYPVSESYYSREISIPMHINLTEIQISMIARILKQNLAAIRDGKEHVK